MSQLGDLLMVRERFYFRQFLAVEMYSRGSRHGRVDRIGHP
jgi:hypothetical protein